jgi:hypothetical protein
MSFTRDNLRTTRYQNRNASSKVEGKSRAQKHDANSDKVEGRQRFPLKGLKAIEKSSDMPENVAHKDHGESRESKCPVFVCAPGLSARALNELQKRFPDYRLVENLKAPPHPHPMCHTERGLFETRLLKKIDHDLPRGSAIVDIGGAPNRHIASGHTVWSCCPVLSSDDAARAHRNDGTPNTCAHTAALCNCVDPGVYLSVNSLYYLSPDEILDLVHRSRGKRLYALFHPHDDPMGSRFGGEYTWHMDQDFKVQVSVHGNVRPYCHDTMLWLRKGYHTLGQRGMAWHELYSTDDTKCYEFSPADPRLETGPEVDAVFSSVVINPIHYGLVDLSTASMKDGLYPSYESVALPKARALSFGKFFLTLTRGHEVVFVPKALIAFAAKQIVGVVRDDKSFQSVLFNVKKESSRYFIPAEMVPMTILHATVIGFTRHAEAEALVMNTVIRPKMSWFASLNDTLRFKFGWNLDFSFLPTLALSGQVVIGGLILFGLLKVGCRVFNGKTPFPYHNSYALQACKTAFLCLLLTTMIPRRKPKGPLLERVEEFETTQESVASAHPVVEPIPPCLPIRGHESTKPLDEIHRDATVTVPEVFEKKDQPALYTTVLSNVSSIPVVPSTSTHNDHIAVNNRGCYDRKGPDELVFNEYFAWVKANFDDLFPDHSPLQYDYDKWNERFPKSQQKRHDAARINVQQYPDLKKFSRRKSFIKKEKLLKSGVGRKEEFNPRLIQGADDHLNVVLGPWMYAFSKRLAETWNSDFVVTYASGMTANSVGTWFYMHHGADPEKTIGMATDAKYFDATYDTQDCDLERYIYKRFGAPNEVLKVLKMQATTSGSMPSGVTYTGTGTRKSGDPNTSCGNSMCNGLKHLYSLWLKHVNHTSLFDPKRPEPLPSQLPVRMIVLGDDNLMILDIAHWKHFSTDDPARTMIFGRAPTDIGPTLTALGLIPKVLTHNNVTALDFCSSLFLPAINPSTGAETILLSPKPGRIFAKFGYTLKLPADVKAQARADALGLIQDVAHIPGLRAYIIKAIELTESVKPAYLAPDHRFHASMRHSAHPMVYTALENYYGVTKAEFDDLEEFIEKIDNPFVLISHPVITKMTEVDSA